MPEVPGADVGEGAQRSSRERLVQGMTLLEMRLGADLCELAITHVGDSYYRVQWGDVVTFFSAEPEWDEVWIIKAAGDAVKKRKEQA